MKLNLPLFWKRSDSGASAKPTPDDIAVLWAYGNEPRSHWISDAGFTPAFDAAYADLERAMKERASDRRTELLYRELDQGRPTLLEWSFLDAPENERRFVKHIVAAAELIEELYAEQQGTSAAFASLLELDPPSRSVLIRNQSPFCMAPETEDDPECTAVPGATRAVGLYPESIQSNPSFCDALADTPADDDLLSPFSVVRRDGDRLRAVPYTEAYGSLMSKVAEHLRSAAASFDVGEEGPFVAYLRAAARAFEDNQWFAADEAWSRMNAENSKWYLRIGPDEVYYDPCNRKAGFHVSFARINQESLAWQRRLEPVKQEMEDAMAALAGDPYRPRRVSFHLPDFIDIVLNAGNSRAPHGATIGQSLPNWGPVANQGRGRTVAMTNLYTDADSRQTITEQVSSLFCPDAMASFSADPSVLTMSVVLHEAAHNLGPAHEYAVKGRTDDEIFGGPMASTLEELKAQTSALYLADWLANKGVISHDEAEKSHVRDLAWAFGHISRGMYDAAERPKSYSQLAAIQVGFFVDREAVIWRPTTKAANGSDTGCLDVDRELLSSAIAELEARVLGIKASGDVDSAEGLKQRYVDAEDRQELLSTIRERWLRAPKASFVYSVRL